MKRHRRFTGIVAALCAPLLISLTPAMATAAPVLEADVELWRTGVNLTAEGNADWVHWGYGATLGTLLFNRKSGVASQISEITHLGGKFRQFRDSRADYQWDDGEPIAGARDVNRGVFSEISGSASGEVGGFEFTVNATTVERVVRVYFGGFRATGHMSVSLSDNSAPPYVMDFQSDVVFDRVLVIRFAAASEGQTLKVRWSFDESDVQLPEGGNLSISAVALEGPRRPEGGITPFLPVLLDE